MVPSRRPTAAEALQNPWLESGDRARALALPRNEDLHQAYTFSNLVHKQKGSDGDVVSMRTRKVPKASVDWKKIKSE